MYQSRFFPTFEESSIRIVSHKTSSYKMVFYCQHCQRGFSQQRYLTQHIQQCHVLSSKRKKRKRNYTDNSTYTLNYSDNIHFDIPKEIIITKNKNKNSKINLNDSISENTKLSDIMDNNNDNIEWYNFDNESNINDDAVATSNENENNVNKLYNSIFFSIFDRIK